MAKNFKNKKVQKSTETMELGKVLYMCQGQPVVKLMAKDIPYPNSPVLDLSSRVIGKVDEILGRLDDVHATIRLENPSGTLKRGETLLSYVDKFIPKKRFLPREEVEKKKEETDRKKSKFRKDQRAERGKPGAFKEKQRLHGRKTNNKWASRQNGKKQEFGKDNRRRKWDSSRSNRND
ncbi:snoRNP Gar1 nucleolar protein [Encephalitozoon romaleae SJ-2008]|uniref:H/ACA ribonucleoprotein complex subunit n=1 Tax=Encephalitozoon romaleae (strain SJ-2008) TaxID=1178016 RepID=I7ALC4_ENCRO|nr:snoRNP Gar1 nucleolar protein [Encephalitozoon romaleae SJ-2008]AFN82464.1 snoRNP Gar1 nucleolar protein [Encephalitozoon romaleae SJ-2008]